MAVVVKDDKIQIQRLELGPWRTNAYIVTCLRTKDVVLIDAPAEADKILEKLGTIPQYILLTHNHMDHIGALTELQSRLNIPLAAHVADAICLSPSPEILLNDGDIVSLGEVKLDVLHTPGHTPGSLCFYTGRYLISGDTIFPGGPGKTGTIADFRQIVESIANRIFSLPDDTQAFPGHGDSTILKKERGEFEAFSARPHDPSLCGDVLWLST
ncbi:MBL fold metallo-hydrolase [Chloroflexota bacterium]